MEPKSTEAANLVSLNTRRTGRLFTLGDLNKDTKEVWLVFHGYRMLASSFIKRFHPIVEEGVAVVAPEGLSRFYVDGVTGKVGASWMTREGRLDEIADQQYWLNQVWEYLQAQVAPQTPVHVIGFSQGVATVWRWMLQTDWQPASFTIWTGKPPEEQNDSWRNRLLNAPMAATFADKDQFISAELAEKMANGWKADYPHLAVFPFEGPHDIPAKPLVELVKWARDSISEG